MKQEEVRQARARIAAALPQPVEILRGSLFRRLIRHKRGCPKCARGSGHPVWVLTVTYRGGKTRQFSLPAARRRQVQQWLRNYRQFRNQLEKICELNHQLLRTEE